ncbi:MAG: dynamin family protein [Lachnospiraceae bacterium]|nr:dynamin family protein [Lachnospiraceae bacterium]
MKNTNPVVLAGKLSGCSEKDIIDYLNISEEELGSWDEDPFSIDARRLKEISLMTGVASERLLPGNTISGPVISPTYEKNTSELVRFINFNRDKCNALVNKYKDIDDEEIAGVLSEIYNTFDNTARQTLERIRKPVVCAYGNSDTGKSTLINYLMGETVAEAGYSPMTSAVVYYHHISDMPEHLRKTGNNAFVFGKKRTESSGSKKKKASANNKNDARVKYSHNDIYDEKKAEEYLLYSGEFKYVISRYSSRDGEEYRQKTSDIYEIVAYLDNDILKELTFIDVPGFGSGDKNDDIVLTLDMNSIDIVFYLMTANGFMRGSDQIYLSRLIKSRTSLADLYILCTQADIIGAPIEVEKRMDSGYDILLNSLPVNLVKRKDLDIKNSLRKRFFAFDTRNNLYCTKLNSSLEESIPKIIEDRINKVKSELREACDGLNHYYVNERKRILENRSPEKKNKDAEEKYLKEQKDFIRLGKAELKNDIEKYRKEVIAGYTARYDVLMRKENLVDLMKKKDIKNKKNDKENFSTYLSNEIEDIFIQETKEKSEQFTNDLNSFLERYKESWTGKNQREKPNVDFSGFDFTQAFATGLAGVGSFGALAIWSSVVAAGSNLGGYILLAKTVSVLSSLGISLGGTSAVASVIAAIGGPVTIGIGLAVLGALAVFKITNDNWQERLAGDLIKSYEKQNVKKKYINNIEKFWDDTTVSMDTCLESLDNNLLDYYHRMNKLQDRIINQDKELYDAIDCILFGISQIYMDIKFKLSVDKEREGNIVFLDKKRIIIEEMNRVCGENNRLRFSSDINDIESIVFLDNDKRGCFWEDIRRICSDDEIGAISLVDNVYIFRREDQYTLYYKKENGKVRVKYVDTYPYMKEQYEDYKNVIINEYPLEKDQIRYKIYDMIAGSKEEILMLMPWINSYGWDDDGYGTSVKDEIRKALIENSDLRVRIFVGYDLEHPNKKKEKETREKAEEVAEDFAEFGDRFEIGCNIGSHEKIITFDGFCAMYGSYNLLSNNAPYNKQKWAADSMLVIENPLNVEKQRRMILERAKV